MQCILITYSVFTEARQSTYFLVNFHSNLSSSNFRVDTFDIFRVIARQTLLAEVILVPQELWRNFSTFSFE